MQVIEFNRGSSVNSTLIIPPTERGRPIIIEGESLEEISNALRHEGFGEVSIDKIIEKIPAG
jgi:hypothetical protein